jgi:hypothetical protein
MLGSHFRHSNAASANAILVKPDHQGKDSSSPSFTFAHHL